MEPPKTGFRRVKGFAGRPTAFASALLCDATRRPAAWLAAAACGTLLLGSALALPSTGGSDRVRLVASHVAGAVFLLSSMAAVLLPASLLTRKKQEEILAGWSVFPSGASATFTGSFLASVALLFAWTVFLPGVGALILLIVLRPAPGEANPLAPR
ncbi:MAG: hypothetical protein ACYS47_19580, partial [Planctomycetota bacterium]